MDKIQNLLRKKVIDKALKPHEIKVDHKTFWLMRNGKVSVPDFFSEKESLNKKTDAFDHEDDENYETVDPKVKNHVEAITERLKDAGLLDDFVVIPADDKTIQIDIDTVEGLAAYHKNWSILASHLEILDINKTISRSERLHITIETNKSFTAVERIAIQAALGSDPCREAYNFRNVMIGHTDPILFVEKKNEWETDL